jgi:hypothetical protein
MAFSVSDEEQILHHLRMLLGRSPSATAVVL